VVEILVRCSVVEDFFFIGNRIGKTNNPIKDKDGLTLTDYWSNGLIENKSIVVVDKKEVFSGNKSTFQ
jgi:hypothetical protein